MSVSQLEFLLTDERDGCRVSLKWGDSLKDEVTVTVSVAADGGPHVDSLCVPRSEIVLLGQLFGEVGS